MPTIEFSGNALGPAVRALAPDGGPMIDVCDEARAPVGFSCRASSCGTCRVEVVAGASLLEPPRAAELETLEALAAPPTHRLACRVIICPGPGLIQLRWTGD